MVFGANTYRQFVRLLGSGTEETGVGDPWVTRMRSNAGNGGVNHTGRTPRLAGCERRERRRRRRTLRTGDTAIAAVTVGQDH